MLRSPIVVDDVELAVDAIINRVGKDIRIGLPLGLGKPVELINALFQRACSDPEVQLTILTALSLEKPSAGSALERAFLQPFADRVFGGVPELDYMRALRAGKLPANVEVCEFFFKPGSLLGNAHAQQHYISSNYSHAARDVFQRGCNVAAQMICRREDEDGVRYSLSCNPDTGPELIELMKQHGRPHMVLGLVNQNLPYMVNDAEITTDILDMVIEHPRYNTPLFSTPKLAVATPDYLIGLQAAALIRDGGTLQVGIGALGDALIHATRLRHEHSAEFREVLDAAGVLAQSADLIEQIGGLTPFGKGLYGASEMFVDGFMHLYRAGILKRAVYDFWALQQLLNEGHCHPQQLDAELLTRFETLGVRVIRTQDFEILQHHGVFNEETRYDQGYLIAPDGSRVIANLADPESRRVIAEQCLGTQLRNGIVLHAGFFLGPRDFYQQLRELPEQELASICMTGVDRVNQLDRNPRLYQHQRQHARFINTGIMATLSGAIVSDGLEDGRVISGVGGQYNFVAQAHQLHSGRSILLVRAVRDQDGKPSTSNIVFNYGHCTIPRHLRDIVITEYGIADLRSKTDSEVAKALIHIADSRFQSALLAQAQQAGKIEAGYQIPAAHRNNLPQRLEQVLSDARVKALFPEYPLGSDFTDLEAVLARALKQVKTRAASTPRWRLLLKAWMTLPPTAAMQPYLERLQLQTPRTLQDRVARSLLIDALRGAGIL